MIIQTIRLNKKTTRSDFMIIQTITMIIAGEEFYE